MEFGFARVDIVTKRKIVCYTDDTLIRDVFKTVLRSSGGRVESMKNKKIFANIHYKGLKCFCLCLWSLNESSLFCKGKVHCFATLAKKKPNISRCGLTSYCKDFGITNTALPFVSLPSKDKIKNNKGDNENMKNAVIYALYSSERQNKQSIESQLRVCNEYVQRNGLYVVETNIDKAITGTNDRRPAFQKM